MLVYIQYILEYKLWIKWYIDFMKTPPNRLHQLLWAFWWNIELYTCFVVTFRSILQLWNTFFHRLEIKGVILKPYVEIYPFSGLYDISFKMTAGSNGTAHSRSQSNTQKLDHSVLRSSIDVSVTGMKQALLALENGNKEVC